MQIVGLILLVFIVWFGFSEREMSRISAFDSHALVVVLVGSLGAILTSSTWGTALRTFSYLRELIPPLARYRPDTLAMEAERKRVAELWRDGKRSQAVDVAERSAYGPIGRMVELMVSRAPRASTETAFMELRHEEMSRSQPPVSNWELLARLAPSFGMVGTITGMIQLFRNMGDDNLNIGAAMSLALLATLYGVAFGAGVAGPIGHYLRNLLDDRIGVIDRCEQSVHELTQSLDARRDAA